MAWPKAPLGELLEVQNGFAFSSKQFSESSGFPLIRIRDLKDNGATAVGFLGNYDADYVVGNGDLLIGMDGEFRCYEWGGGPALLNQRVCRLRRFDSRLHPRFLFYGINRYLKEIEDQTSFTTVKHLSSKTIKGIDFPLPALEQQKRIVAVLDQAFAALDRARALTEANLADAEEVFESVRFSIFDKVEKSHPAKSLGQICSRVSVGHVGETSKHYVETDGIPFLRSQNVRPSGLDLDGTRYISSEFHSKLKKSQLVGGELLFVRVGANRSDCCLVPKGLGPMNCANVVFAKPVEGELQYLEAFCQSRQGKDRLLGMTTGSAQGVINTKSVATLNVPMPPIDVQQDVAQNLGKVRQMTNALARAFSYQINDITDLRQSLLQKAFAGELT
ncbi:restriction endonuclease subunit S [Sphingomonas ursincola]|nr:restriction endonuclease subunit S [Sphingomonas ursincola]